MRKLVLTCLASGLFAASGFAQTLFTYGSKPVSKEEFLRVYQKNSISKKPDFSEPALREYLDLYSLFRMKVTEADLQHLDTLPAIQRELDNYRKQLAKNYLTDEEVSNKLVHEAYDRMKEEVHVQHLLIMATQGQDTLAAFKKTDSIYNALLKGADFTEMARKYTDDRGSKETGGDLGYMTALQTVYPFENVMYATPKGKVSAPFRSQFGYHILKVVDRRPAMGEIRVAHILISVPASAAPASDLKNNKRLDSVVNDLKKGMSFEDAVKKYSDDKFSKEKGGELAPFGVGRVSPAFEAAAFGLKKPGDVSQPVKTEYGYHIVKLIERIPLKPFDSLSVAIKKKVENDSRAQTARDAYIDKIKRTNGFKDDPAALNAVVARMETLPDTGKNANSFKVDDFRSMNQPVFTLAGHKYLQSDFVSYLNSITGGRLNGPRRATVTDIYKMFVNTVVNDFQEHKLVDENPDFKNLMEEYRAGIMLFELMDRNVWGKAAKDSTGLKAFYESRKSKYMWEPGFTGSVYKFKTDSILKEGQKMLEKKDVKNEDIVKKLNSDATPERVTIQHGHFEFSRFKDVPQSAIAKGKVSAPVKNADGSYTVVKADEVFNGPSQKSLDDARGYVVAEYQDYLEKQWNDQMRKKYTVQVNNDVFKSMVK